LTRRSKSKQAEALENLNVTLEGTKMKLFKFTKDEDGAVTVDWVVLTAALVLVGGVVVSAIRGGMEDLASDINTQLSATSVS
jgi:Flp pilus assembly pilin Flp